MSLNPTENSSDSHADELQIELEDNDFSDPYIVSVMTEKQDDETPEDIGFQDYRDILSE